MKKIQSFELCLYRRMLKIWWSNKIINSEVQHRKGIFIIHRENWTYVIIDQKEEEISWLRNLRERFN